MDNQEEKSNTSKQKMLPAQSEQPALAAQGESSTPAPSATPPETPSQKQLSPLMQMKGEKDKLLDEAKTLNTQILELRESLAPISLEIKKTEGPAAGRLRAEIDAIEFEIATSAFTPKAEKDLIKRKKELEKQLGGSKVNEELRSKSDVLRNKLRELSSRRKDVDKRLNELRKSMSEEYERTIKEREKRQLAQLKDRVKREKEAEDAKNPHKSAAPSARGESFRSRPRHADGDFPQRGRRREREHLDEEERKFLQKHDAFVSLGDIVQMSKKKEGEEEAESQESKTSSEQQQ